jgi:hypothetical protein
MQTLSARTDKKKRKFVFISNENEKNETFHSQKNETLTSLHCSILLGLTQSVRIRTHIDRPKKVTKN